MNARPVTDEEIANRVRWIERRGLLPAFDGAARQHYVTVEDILGPGRYTAVFSARRSVAIALVAPPFSLSVADAARVLGRAHPTVLEMIQTGRAERREATDMVAAINAARRTLRVA